MTKVTFDLLDETWNWDIALTPGANTLLIAFTADTPTVVFDDIQMAFELSLNGQVVQSGEYPPPGVKLISSDQEYVCTRHGVFRPDDELTVKVTITNGGNTYESQETAIVPRPDSPYDSWVWNDTRKTWEAPEPYPDDGLSYTWDEPSLSWVEVSGDDQPP